VIERAEVPVFPLAIAIMRITLAAVITRP